MNTIKQEKVFLRVVPVMLAFFAMGFVDLVGIATNYVKADFDLSDTVANLFPQWFFSGSLSSRSHGDADE